MMVMLGTDAHKRSHTIVAVDTAGAEIGSVTVAATTDGHLRAVQWAAQYTKRQWAIEDCRALSRRLEADLLGLGERVVRVPPKMMARARSTARQAGKSDPIDALAVGRAALREPDLPVAQLDGPSREVRLLIDYRETLVHQRTGFQNQLRWRLHELEPGFDPPAGSLNRYCTLDAIDELITTHDSMVADLARRETARIRELTAEINQLEADITRRVTDLVPSLLAIPGCGALTAGKLIGEAADITRFKTRDAYAMWAGVAPIPVWSANPNRFRLNRGGNRQTNAALHRIAITQARIHPDAQAFIKRRIETGSTKREALRLLKRKLANVVYRTLLTDTQTTPLAQAA
jgi:transposase